MKTITTDPLWAWAIFGGLRPIENRPTSTDHVGPLLVHASQSMRQTPYIREWIRCHTLYLPPPDWLIDRDYRGRVIGEVDMIGCVTVDELPQREREFAVGPWCWRFRNPRSFVYPFPRVDASDLSDTPTMPTTRPIR